MADFSDYQDLVNPGGFIVFDDYQFSRVKNGVNKTVEGLTDKDNIGKFNIIGDIDNIAKAYDLPESGGKNVAGKSFEFIIQKI